MKYRMIKIKRNKISQYVPLLWQGPQMVLD